MNLWERLRRKLAGAEPQEPVDARAEAGKHEAEKAKENAELNLRATRRTGDEVTRVTESLRQLRARNHFGEAIEQAMLARRTRG